MALPDFFSLPVGPGRSPIPGALLVALLATVTASACVHTEAKTTPDTPPLDVPAPPPRVVVTNQVEAPAPVPLVPPRPPSTARPTPAAAPRSDPPRSEAPPVEPKPVDEPARTPPASLQTTPAGAESQVDQTIRALLLRATSDLNRIDYRRLNADARTQYDTAKRFVRQTEDALRVKNLVFARNLADKAVTLAAQLAAK